MVSGGALVPLGEYWTLPFTTTNGENSEVCVISGPIDLTNGEKERVLLWS